MKKLLVATLFAASAVAFAQEETVTRLYIMPLVSVVNERGITQRYPKYRDTSLASANWGAMDYGFRPVCLVAADMTNTDHAALIANADVYAFPDNFQTSGATVANQSATLTNKLESFGIPAQWVGSQSTYLSVAHTAGAMFQYMGRLNSILGNVDPFAGATLNTKISGLSQATQDAIFAAGASFGWNMNGISNQTTLRNAIKYMADQWGATLLDFGVVIL
jgi:hypothetical protein